VVLITIFADNMIGNSILDVYKKIQRCGKLNFYFRTHLSSKVL